MALRGRLNKELFKHIVEHVEFFTADAAGDEQRAGQILSTSEIFPLLKLVIKDRAHATRRITKRGWAADDFISRVFCTVVSEKSSITKLVDNSDTFNSWFGEAIHQAEQKPVLSERIQSLRYAKQRFDSTAKPLGRAVLFMEALIAVAQKISTVRGRSSEEGRRAESFLSFIGPEELLTLAMAADAGDESLMLTRLADDEAMDATTWPHHCEDYLQRLLTLFGTSEFCFESGFTRYMLEFLECRHVYFVEGNPRSIGGRGVVTEQLKSRCISRFRNWVFLVRTIIKAEFPDFDVVSSMSVFSFRKAMTWARTKECLDRLATYAQVDPEVLADEFQYAQPLARQFHEKGDSEPECWQQTLSMLDGAQVLPRILVSVAAFGGSSSGVEQAFSMTNWALEGRRSWMSGSFQNNELKLIVDRRNNLEDSDIISRAQKIWVRGMLAFQSK